MDKSASSTQTTGEHSNLPATKAVTRRFSMQNPLVSDCSLLGEPSQRRFESSGCSLSTAAEKQHKSVNPATTYFRSKLSAGVITLKT